MLTLGTLKTCLLVNLLFCADQLLSLFAMLMINVSTYLLLAKMLVSCYHFFGLLRKFIFLLSAVFVCNREVQLSIYIIYLFKV